jgi:putative nucleotidyltransferase with HDIG domain
MEKPLAQESLDVPIARQKGFRVIWPRLRSTLRIKITLPFLILAFAMAAGAAYIVTQIVFDTVDERFTNTLIASGRLVSEALVKREKALITSLRQYTFSEGLAAAIQAGDVQRLGGLVYYLAISQGEEVVEFLDDEGNLVLSMRQIEGDEPRHYDVAEERSIDYSSLPFVQKVLSGEKDEQGDKFAGLARSPDGDILYVAGPILDQSGELAGVALVGKTLPTLLKELHDATQAEITMYDRSGQTLLSTFRDPNTLDAGWAGQILARQDTHSLKRVLETPRQVNISNVTYGEILGPWELRGRTEDLGVIGTALPQILPVWASAATRVEITLLFSLALFLVIMLGVSIANVITRPLRSLLLASEQVAGGDLTVQVTPKGNDEIAILTQSFNEMVHSLSDSKMDLLKAYDSTLVGWSNALELRDQETEGHTQRVTALTIDLARWMGVPDIDLDNIRRGALLHDIGKMGIPDMILLKPGKLTPAEWVIMRKHPQYAYEMIYPIEYLRPALDIPYCHHERWDGAGYPRGLKGEDIPMAARIFAVIDVWDAMRSHRPYRQALPVDEVCEYINSASGAHFDPAVVDAFFELLGRRPCEIEFPGDI